MRYNGVGVVLHWMFSGGGGVRVDLECVRRERCLKRSCMTSLDTFPHMEKMMVVRLAFLLSINGSV